MQSDKQIIVGDLVLRRLAARPMVDELIRVVHRDSDGFEMWTAGPGRWYVARPLTDGGREWYHVERKKIGLVARELWKEANGG